MASGGHASLGRFWRPAEYGSLEFDQSSELARELYAAMADGTPWWPIVRRNLGTAVLAGRLITRLPWITVWLHDRSGEISRRLGRRIAGFPSGRLIRAALRLPASEAEYLRGRHRQAMRTNLRRARAMGVTCHCVLAWQDRLDLERQVLARRGFGEPPMAEWLDVTMGAQVFFVARAPDVTPLVIASVSVDGRCAYLQVFMSSPHPLSGCARYLLQAHLAVELGAAGVEYLLADNALQLPRGLQYFQHLAGFTVVNVRVRWLAGRRAGVLQALPAMPGRPPAPNNSLRNTAYS